MTCAEFLSRLQGVRRSGNRWMARCPAHEDENASLSVAESGGKILLHDFGGCATEAILAVMGLTMADLFTDSNGHRGEGRRIVTTYPYTDEKGQLLFEVVRYEPKDFRQRRPDGKSGWISNLNGVRRVPYRLPEVIKAKSVLVCEGEKDCETARSLRLVATSNPGGAGKWRSEFAEVLRGKRVVMICDADEKGVSHGRDVVRLLVGVAESVRLIEALPGVPNKGDLTDFIELGGTREKLLQLIKETPVLTAADVATWGKPKAVSPWAAESMDTFLNGVEADAVFLDVEKRFLARECVTEVFSPRGLGKSLFALWLALNCANRGLRVLYIDRDNPRRIVKNRLRNFGAEPETNNLGIITREKCPPLTDAAAWASFPYADYDLIILDSLDSLTEGVGEQDSAKPSRAIAPLLDIARRENGPAVLILGNCTKSAKHSRGSGVIEDRADVVYEVRDATDLQPSGSKPWIEELPPIDAGSWANRASRRKQREKYRLAFIASKFRIDEEPEPFILEIDTTTGPWRVCDVTDQIDAEGATAREEKNRERHKAIHRAVDLLASEIQRRSKIAEAPILKKQAEEFLMKSGTSQRISREAVNAQSFEVVGISGKGHPRIVRLAKKKDESNRNNIVMEPPETLSENDADFGCPQSMHPTEIDPSQTCENSGFWRGGISVKDSLFSPTTEPEDDSMEV